MAVAERIRCLLHEKRMSQRELARLAGLSSSGMCSIINGTACPKEDTIRRIASVLGVPASALMTDAAQGASETMHELIVATSSLSENEMRRVLDFVSGMKAAKGE